MTDDETTFKERVTRQGEEAIGRLAQELLESPIVTGALSAAFETRERALRAQELAMGALNLPSAGDLERLTRRVRSVSQRLEGIEDGLDRIDDRMQRSDGTAPLEQRLARIEATLERLETLERPAPAAAPQAAPAAAAPAAAKAATRRATPRTSAPRASTPRASSSRTAVNRAKSEARGSGRGRSPRSS